MTENNDVKQDILEAEMKKLELKDRKIRNLNRTLDLIGRNIKVFKDGTAPQFKEWINNFGHTLSILEVNLKEGTALVPYLLAGPALSKYDTLSNEEKKDWSKMGEKLLKLHACDAEKEIALQELSMMKQGKKTVQEFYELVRTRGSYAYEDVEESARERLLATVFLNGINLDIKKELHRLPQQPKTLNEIRLKAEQISRLLQIEKEQEEKELNETNMTIASLRCQIAQYQQQGNGWNDGTNGWNYNQNRQDEYWDDEDEEEEYWDGNQQCNGQCPCCGNHTHWNDNRTGW